MDRGWRWLAISVWRGNYWWYRSRWSAAGWWLVFRSKFCFFSLMLLSIFLYFCYFASTKIKKKEKRPLNSILLTFFFRFLPSPTSPPPFSRIGKMTSKKGKERKVQQLPRCTITPLVRLLRPVQGERQGSAGWEDPRLPTERRRSFDPSGPRVKPLDLHHWIWLPFHSLTALLLLRQPQPDLIRGRRKRIALRALQKDQEGLTLPYPLCRPIPLGLKWKWVALFFFSYQLLYFFC